MKKLSSLRLSALSIINPIILAQSAMGVITIHFVEEGPDLRVSFSGTLDVSTPAVPTLVMGTQAGVLSFGVVNIVGKHVSNELSGQNTILPFGTALFDTSNLVDFGRPFGFFAQSVLYTNEHVTDVTTMGTTQVTADPSLDHFLLPGVSLDDVNTEFSDIVEGATLWTANNTGDTFIFSRKAPIPEPSSVMLVGLGALGLLHRRR